MTPKAMGHLSKVMAEKLPEGLKVRSIFCENVKESKVLLPAGKNIERKLLPEVPLILMVSEKSGSVSFPKTDGQMDFASFFGSDPLFMGYMVDFFLFYWGQAETWH